MSLCQNRLAEERYVLTPWQCTHSLGVADADLAIAANGAVTTPLGSTPGRRGMPRGSST